MVEVAGVEQAGETMAGGGELFGCRYQNELIHRDALTGGGIEESFAKAGGNPAAVKHHVDDLG